MRPEEVDSDTSNSSSRRESTAQGEEQLEGFFASLPSGMIKVSCWGGGGGGCVGGGGCHCGEDGWMCGGGGWKVCERRKCMKGLSVTTS